jgi:hypothetical protein
VTKLDRSDNLCPSNGDYYQQEIADLFWLIEKLKNIHVKYRK